MNIWQNAVITYQGLALQAKLIAGNTLNITKVVIGSGYVPPESLRLQTDVTDPQKTLTKVNSITYPETGKCAIKIRIDNSDVSEKFTAKQVGFYASDPDLGEILYFIAQAGEGTGTIVPANTEMYKYSAEWTFYFQYGQADNVTVVVDPSNCISQAELEDFVKEQLKNYVLHSEKGAANGVATLDGTLKLNARQIPDIDCGVWGAIPVGPVQIHDQTSATHPAMVVDGNNTEVMDDSKTLEEHIASPYAHQNLVIDGNNEIF